MRILCITPWFPRYPNDQTGNYIFDSIQSLLSLGNEVIVLITQPWRPAVAGLFHPDWIKKKINPKLFPGIHIHICQYLSIPRGFCCTISNWSYRTRVNTILKKIVQKYQCQVIHAHTELCGLAAVDVGAKLGIPTVLTLHGINPNRRFYIGNARRQLFEYTLSKANRVILVGSTLKNFARNFVTEHDHFRIVPNGFRLNFQKQKNIEKSRLQNKMRFISVSNLHEGKGIDINIYALAKLKESGINEWTYKIVGDGKERKKLENLVNKLNLTQQVFFRGDCNHMEVYAQLLQSDIFILPSYKEAFGVAYLEAMSFGLLTIGIEGQGPQDFIEHQKTGLLVPPRDIDALANTIKKIFTSDNKMRDIAEAGKKHVHNNFTWHSHATKMMKVYEELVNNC